MSGPLFINFPTLQAECNDTEARSLKKINDLQYQLVSSIAAIAKPGGTAVGTTDYVYGQASIGAVGANLLDVACYNPTDLDVWVMVFGSPPAAGQRPLFLIRVYAHNHAYYEALTSTVSFAAGRYYIVVSSNEQTFSMNNNPVFLAIRHS